MNIDLEKIAEGAYDDEMEKLALSKKTLVSASKKAILKATKLFEAKSVLTGKKISRNLKGLYKKDIASVNSQVADAMRSKSKTGLRDIAKNQIGHKRMAARMLKMHTGAL